MLTNIGHFTLLVHDHDETITFFTKKVGFHLKEDVTLGEGMRWVTLTSAVDEATKLTLVKADTQEKKALVGRQAADHILITITTDDCMKDYELMRANGVRFTSEPRVMPWGIEVVFEDLYGNRYDLVQPR